MSYEQRITNTHELVRGPDGKWRDAVVDMLSNARVFESHNEMEEQGDGDADGTSILDFELPANRTFVCTSLILSSNLAALIRVGIGDLADPPEDVYWVDVGARGNAGAISDGNNPLFVINADSSAQTIRIYAPQSAFDLATNNDANHFFNAFIGGLIV